ncbi:c-type cytochrome [Silvimonas iriomotensis]|uniref:Cytochrome c domain-containing protein n=1 Tax=Silvimonas iriomotensis TaxID=449662 RepID=A0ABQ2P429_9NEIS|nr:c-type cytochrome [Silvimonas iriomotensis]GGP17823.1 hypothetical protein GCM10010970_01730 [Silvimonas iriomotensis]
MKKILLSVAVLFVVGGAAFFALTAPAAWRATHAQRDGVSSLTADLKNGRNQFLAGDCATCHATPGSADDTRLGGGRALDTAFGIFHMPNISSDTNDGIGSWTLAQFTIAMREGVLPDKGNAYPAFPYTSYQRMTADDLRDLFAYIKSLPPVAGKAPDHELKFPFSIRRGVGLWRLAFLDGKPVQALDGYNSKISGDPVWQRGRYLVEGAAHCAECHSPRNLMGAVPASQRFGGGPNAEGTGYVPNISPDETGIGYWSVNDITRYLKHGVNPIGIKAGGDMKEVIANTSRLPDEDILAMATYLKTVNAVDAPNAGLPPPNRTEEVVMLPDTQQASNASRLDSLVAPAAELAKSDVLYVVKPQPFMLDPAQSKEDGKLLGATRLAVLARQGDLVQVRVEGWQQAGAESAFHAMKGQRILQAVLSPEAIARVQSAGTVRDELTGLDWQQGSLNVWIKQDGLATRLDPLWQHSDETYRRSCATCHALPHSQDFMANQWIGTLGAMKRYTSLDDSEYRLLLAWLQYHSRDVGAGAAHP